MGILGAVWRNAPDLLFWVVAMVLHASVFLWLRRQAWAKRHAAWTAGAGLAASAIWITLCVIFSINYFAAMIPEGDGIRWARGMGLLWGLTTVGAFAMLLFTSRWKTPASFHPDRRQFLKTTQTAMVASPVLLTGFGVYSAHNDFHVKEVDVPMRGLPKDLDGLRILQLSDIHMSPFLSERELERVVDMANETKAHIAVVTGDLVTGPHDPIDACLRQLRRLKADAGVLGCMGNHEIFADCQEYVKKNGAKIGIDFLRQENRLLRFGNASLNIVGVDYQPFRNPYLVGVEKMVDRSATNILLSHNPDVFPVAANQGFDLTIAGHTHGGQVTVEILHQYLNVARFFTPYVYGHYQKGNSALYVTRGVGTVGIPARIGAPPEITVIRLCAA